VLGMLLFMAGLLRFLPLLGPEDSIPQVLIEGLGGGNVFFFACMMGAAGLILSYRWGTLKNENQNALPPVQNGSGKNELVVDGKSSRYTKSSIPESLLSEYELAVSKYLVEEGAFLDEDISLEKVAKKLRVPRHHMSQVFTLRLGKTFSHYVNDLRIAHAVNLLALRSDLPINELASQSGYSSRISFVRHFKRVKGCPPSHYSAAQ
jgi:AraC-like DNA-binding protein